MNNKSSFNFADVTYDKVRKAVHSLDSRFVSPTSAKGDKWVYYPSTMHANAVNVKQFAASIYIFLNGVTQKIKQYRLGLI